MGVSNPLRLRHLPRSGEISIFLFRFIRLPYDHATINDRAPFLKRESFRCTAGAQSDFCPDRRHSHRPKAVGQVERPDQGEVVARLWIAPLARRSVPFVHRLWSGCPSDELAVEFRTLRRSRSVAGDAKAKPSRNTDPSASPSRDISPRRLA